MSYTIFGEHFRPMPILAEILYYACMVLAGVFVLRNLYLAVRAPRKDRSRIASGYLARAGGICILAAVLLYFIYYI